MFYFYSYETVYILYILIMNILNDNLNQTYFKNIYNFSYTHNISQIYCKHNVINMSFLFFTFKYNIFFYVIRKIYVYLIK